MLRVDNLSVRQGALVIVDGVSLSVGEGEWLMIAGPNGAGKSTLISAVLQGTKYTGSVQFEGCDLSHMRPAVRARLIGAVAQSNHVGYSYTVEQIVRLGRYAYSKGLFSASGIEDEDKVREALALTGMLPMKDQSVLTLSGGELQRTFLAQALAQEPRLLILDEPASHLDLACQRQVFELIKGWLEAPGRAVISVGHDLSLARAYGTHAMLMDMGRAVAQGVAGDVFTRENLQSVYKMDVHEWMRKMLGQWQ